MSLKIVEVHLLSTTWKLEQDFLKQVRERVPFFNKSYIKGVPFLPKWYMKG